MRPVDNLTLSGIGYSLQLIDDINNLFTTSPTSPPALSKDKKTYTTAKTAQPYTVAFGVQQISFCGLATNATVSDISLNHKTFNLSKNALGSENIFVEHG